jgi:hypothetical protein
MNEASISRFYPVDNDGRVSRTVGPVLVALTLLVVLVAIRRALFIPWWFNTDEVVIFYEVIRQLRLDLTQTFFDIPGTPFMTLTSVVTCGWWSIERWVGLTTITNPSQFAFANIQGVFVLMRLITVGCYTVAVGMTYVTARRAGGVAVGTMAAILVATLPIHVQYSYFVRTESLGLVACLSAGLIFLHPRTRGSIATYLACGMLVGIAMGARFHFVLVGLPLLLALHYLAVRPDSNGATPLARRIIDGAGLCLAALFIAGAVVSVVFLAGRLGAGRLTHTMLLSSPGGPGLYPGAKHALARLWLLLGLGSGVAVGCHLFPAGRRWIRHLVTPFTITLCIGFAAGFVLAHPTFLWRGEWQLSSIQFYSDWSDPELVKIGAIASWWKVARYYFDATFPETWLKIAFLLGAAGILWRRRPVPLAFLATASMCFIAHPVTMKLWPHHIIPWLPWMCFVAAYPIGLLLELVASSPRPIAARRTLTVAVAALAVWIAAARVPAAVTYYQTSQDRVKQITAMSSWLNGHVPAQAYLLVSYFSLNDDGFLRLIENAGVTVPDSAKEHRNVQIWWLERSAIEGKEGYLCISRADISFFHDDFERKKPGSTDDPFHDSHFQPLAVFGGGFYELTVFHFDLRAPSAKSPSPKPRVPTTWHRPVPPIDRASSELISRAPGRLSASR